MGTPAFDVLTSAVLILGLGTLGAAVGIFLVMEFHFHRQVAREARRLVLASRLSPMPEEQGPEVFWSGSSREDREIILDILVEQCASSDAKWRLGVKQMLGGLGVFDRWLRELQGGPVARRVQAAIRLGSIHDSRGVQALVAAAADDSWQVRLAVTMALGRLKDPEGVSGLVRVAQNPARSVPDLTLAAALAACAEGNPSLLAPMLLSPGPRQRIVASWALSEVGDLSVVDQLLVVTRDPDPEVRAKSARALARIHAPASIEALCRLAKDKVWFVRVRALDALGELREPAGENVALGALEDSAREVRYQAAATLRRICGMNSETAATVLKTCSRRGFNSLISEWDRAGFVGTMVSRLSPRDWPQFLDTLRSIRILISAGVTHALGNFILVFPDIKVRLRMVRLFLESGSSDVHAQLLALAKEPSCDPRVACKIATAFPHPNGIQRRKRQR